MRKIIIETRKSGYQMPTEIYFGRGTLGKLSNIIRKQKQKKFLLVTGSHLANHKIKNGLHKTKKVFNYPFKITTSDFEGVIKNFFCFMQSVLYLMICKVRSCH